MNKPISPAVLNGLYDRLVDERLSAELASLIQANQASVLALPAEERSARLAEAFVKILVGILDGVEPDDAGTPREQAQMAVIAGLLGLLRKEHRATDTTSWPRPLSALRSIHRQSAPFLPPATGVLRPWLFTAGRADPSLLADLRAEFDSADEVDILVSFIKWSGVRKLIDRFEAGAVTGAAGVPRRRVRILTTTYMGATEARAVLALAKLPGVTVKISYDARRTRLHAKAWLFHRATGFGTAFVGSANISNAALIGGLEWTVKFTQAAQADLYAAAQAQFESLWNDPEFERFDPDSEAALRRLSAALSEEARAPDAGETVFFDLMPKAYQAEMLNRLARERELGRTRNLLVAATGTGKTVVAALDYRALCKAQGGQPRLLFVAHRVEILRQAMATYRQALRAPAFGEVLAEGRTPDSYDHLFASIQSVGAAELLERFGPDYWHTVVIDECRERAACRVHGEAVRRRRARGGAGHGRDRQGRASRDSSAARERRNPDRLHLRPVQRRRRPAGGEHASAAAAYAEPGALRAAARTRAAAHAGQGIVPRPRLRRALPGRIPLRSAPPGDDGAAEAAPDRGPRARVSHPAARLPSRGSIASPASGCWRASNTSPGRPGRGSRGSCKAMRP